MSNSSSNTTCCTFNGGCGEEAVGNQNIDFEDVENDTFENVCDREYAN